MTKILINGLNVKPTKNNSWKVGIFTKDKDGNEVWINGFLNNHPTWQKGDEVELEIYNDEKWGLQFRLPEGAEDPKQQPLNTTELLNKIKSLELRISRLEGACGVSTIPEPQNTPTSDSTASQGTGLSEVERQMREAGL